MMPELSLNILDVVQNSISAGATLIKIKIAADSHSDRLAVSVSDNGRGMTGEETGMATDPFYTTRETRDVGLGLPFFKMAAEITGGYLEIKSEIGEGTDVTAVFSMSHIDRMPMGDIAETITLLIGANPGLDFVFEYSFDECSFDLDTRVIKTDIGDTHIYKPQVLELIKREILVGVDNCGKTL